MSERDGIEREGQAPAARSRWIALLIAGGCIACCVGPLLAVGGIAASSLAALHGPLWLAGGELGLTLAAALALRARRTGRSCSGRCSPASTCGCSGAGSKA